MWFDRRKRRRKLPPVELQLTPMLDVFVILLVFLLSSYNGTEVTATVAKGVTLPLSLSTSNISYGIMVQVSASTIWVEDKIVLDVNTPDQTNVYDQDGRRIIPLYNALVDRKQMIQNIKTASPNAKEFTGVVNLIVDKSIRYSFIKKLMFTAAEAGYKEFKLVVRSVN